MPTVHTDLPALLDFTHGNLDTYWRGLSEQVEAAGARQVGVNDGAVAWLGLGAARLHHLRTGELTSKSGGGHYVLDHLDPRFATIALESLRLREDPASPTLHANAEQRGRDVHDLLCWLVGDGTRRAPEGRPGQGLA